MLFCVFYQSSVATLSEVRRYNGRALGYNELDRGKDPQAVEEAAEEDLRRCQGYSPRGRCQTWQLH